MTGELCIFTQLYDIGVWICGLWMTKGVTGARTEPFWIDIGAWVRDFIEKCYCYFLERSSLLFSFLLRPILSDWISEAALSSLTTWIDPLHFRAKSRHQHLSFSFS